MKKAVLIFLITLFLGCKNNALKPVVVTTHESVQNADNQMLPQESPFSKYFHNFTYKNKRAFKISDDFVPTNSLIPLEVKDLRVFFNDSDKKAFSNQLCERYYYSEYPDNSHFEAFTFLIFNEYYWYICCNFNIKTMMLWVQ